MESSTGLEIPPNTLLSFDWTKVTPFLRGETQQSKAQENSKEVFRFDCSLNKYVA